jgi:hypothetical protein
MLVYNHIPSFAALESSLGHVDYVVLIDNASRPDVRAALRQFCSRYPTQCILIQNESNLGISKAYNQAVARLVSQGIYWVYFADHDAYFEEPFFIETRKAWRTLEGRGVAVGMVVPIVTDDPALFNTTLGFRRPYSSVASAITSGILTNVDVFAKLGGFDETFFVEAADFDLTNRVRHAGYRICLVNRALILQQFEQTPDPDLTSARIAAPFVRFRSLVRVGIGNANIFRTSLSYYSEARRADLYGNLGSLVQRGGSLRTHALLVYALDKLEEVYVTRFARPAHPPANGGSDRVE